MAKTRVPVAGTIGKSIKTISATPPQNLTITPAQIQAIIAAVNASQLAANPSGAAPTFWQLISEIPQNIVDIAALISSGYLVRNPDGTWALVPPSPPGQPGLDGEPGEDGERGAPGAPGKDGLTVMGPPGIDGEDGMDGAMGPPGPQGPAGSGATGAQGPMGNPGQDGSDGADGDQGPPGLLGPQGPTGTTGGQGPMGNPGVAGDDGVDGDVGPPGQIGPQGPTGTTGATGSAGQQGVMGVPNPMEGPQGEDGIMGPQGPQGPAGATGAPGAIGSATYQITFGDESGGGGEDPRPFLDTGASPTWSGQHTFVNGASFQGLYGNGVISTARSAVVPQVAGGNPRVVWMNASGVTDGRYFEIVTGAAIILFRVENDAQTIVSNFMAVTRSAAAIADVSLGNPTDNPTFNFLGTGLATFHGSVTATAVGPQVTLTDTGAHGTFLQLQATNTGTTLNASWFNTRPGDFNIQTANVTRMAFTMDGNVSVATPATGIAFTSSGANNGFAGDFVGSATTGQSRGLRVRAGTNASDFAFQVANQANTITYAQVGGDGSTVWGYNGTTNVINTTAAGNVTIAVAASGALLSLPNASAQIAWQSTGAQFGTGIAFSVGQAELTSVSTIPLGVGTSGAAALNFYTNSVGRIIVGAAGNVSINAPSTNNALVVTGCASQNAVQFNGAAGAGTSFGLRVDAGTNTSDRALYIGNQAGTVEYFSVRGDGLATFSGQLGVSTIGKGLAIASGTNAKVGSGTLDATGQRTVANTSVTANSLIFATYVSGPGGPLTTAISVTSQTAGTGFVAAGTPSAPFIYMIVEKI